MRRTFLWVNFVLASLIVLLIFAQAYFITAYATGAEDALDWHGFIGFAIIHPAELLVFLTAFGAWPRAWRWIGFTFFLIVLGTVQISLAPPDEDPASGWVHGLHGLLALVVLVTAAVIAHKGMRDLGLTRASRGDDAGTAPPPPLP